MLDASRSRVRLGRAMDRPDGVDEDEHDAQAGGKEDLPGPRAASLRRCHARGHAAGRAGAQVVATAGQPPVVLGDGLEADRGGQAERVLPGPGDELDAHRQAVGAEPGRRHQRRESGVVPEPGVARDDVVQVEHLAVDAHGEVVQPRGGGADAGGEQHVHPGRVHAVEDVLLHRAAGGGAPAGSPRPAARSRSPAGRWCRRRRGRGGGCWPPGWRRVRRRRRSRIRRARPRARRTRWARSRRRGRRTPRGRPRTRRARRRRSAR